MLDQSPTPYVGSPFLAAVAWATEVHRHDTRRDGRTPYLSHVLAVAALTMQDGGDEATVTAAALHDTVERGGGAPLLREIRHRFGPEVADVVDACSDRDDPCELSWALRKAAHVERWRTEALSVAALTVAAADKLDNVRTLLTALRCEGPSAWDGYHAEPSEVIGYYGVMLEILEARLPFSRNVLALRVAVTELERVSDGVLEATARI